MAPGPGAGAGPMTPQDMMSQADQIAKQLLTMPYEQRRVEMSKIKRSNETLHSLVVTQIDKVRNSAKNQGGMQLLQQQAGQGGGH